MLDQAKGGRPLETELGKQFARVPALPRRMAVGPERATGRQAKGEAVA